MKRTLRAALGFILAIASAAAGQKIYLGDYYHPKLKAGEIAIRRVVVLPPSLQMTKDTMKGGQSMEKENEKVGPVIDRAIIKSLKESGVTVSEASPTDEALLASPELRESVANLQRSFDSISTAMLGKLKDIKKGRFKLGDEIAEVKWSEKDHSDTLIFVRGFGGRQTKSKAFAAGGGLLGALMAGGVHMNLIMFFVDANSGDVLLAKAFFVGVKDEDTENRLVQDLEKHLKPNVKKGSFGTM
jgi:hypothetical protein